MIKNSIILIFFCWLSPAIILSTLHAQVSIGSTEPPAQGTLLHLKEYESNQDNSTKGLGLPRVQLKSLIIEDGSSNLSTTVSGATGVWDKDAHLGLVIYNTNQCLNYINDSRGAYAWNGEIWQSLMEESQSPEIKKWLDPRDGEVYLYRDFGTEAGEWMLENLRYVPQAIDGYDNYTNSATDSSQDKYYVYPENNENPYNPSNHPSALWHVKKKNGILYNWPAAVNGENASTSNQGQGQSNEGPTTFVRGVCPVDWHIPNDKEWNDLEREIYNTANLYSDYTEIEKNIWSPWLQTWEILSSTIDSQGYRPTSANEAQGSAMKSICPPYGSIKVTNGKSFTPSLGGFNVLLVGYANSGRTDTYGERAYFWSSSSYNSTLAFRRRIADNSAVVHKLAVFRYDLFSVRCKKD